MRRRFVVGNWKMNGCRASIDALLTGIEAGLSDLDGVRIAVCVPAVYLAQVVERLAGCAIEVGAQTVGDHDDGPFTGEVSAAMLRDVGCALAIVGHSERRHHYGESDALVAARFVAARRGGVMPILCVGERLDERRTGQTEAVIGRQLDAVIDAAGVAALSHAVIAYEPVWAIGTGETATPAQAQAVHVFISNKIAALDASIAAALTIQYGGSVKPANAAALLAQPDIDGGLIGGAALNADDFLAICRAGSASGLGDH